MARTHTVQRGETLWGIAEHYFDDGTKYQEIAKWNNISNPNYITVGQVLKLEKSSSSSGTSTTTKKSKKAVIKTFGIQSNSDNTLLAVWQWDSNVSILDTSKTDSYKIVWQYDTGDGVWFYADDSETKYKYSTCNIESNATRYRFRVKPISKTYEKNDKDVKYWTAEWSDWKSFNVKSLPPATPPAPDVSGSTKYQLIARLSNLDLDPVNTPTHIKFRVIKNNTSTFNTGTAKINKNYEFVSYSCNLDAGYTYYVECKAVRGKLESDEWSDHSSEIITPPAAPAGFTTCKADSETSVYLKWKSVRTATGYEIEYTTKKDHFDKSDEVQSKSVENTTSYYIEGLESGKEYFFRIRATRDNANDPSPWSKISSTIVGSKPAAPTTWSSTTTAVAGEPLTLYWIHNSVDGSSQTYAQLQISINDVMQPIKTIPNSTEEDEKDKVSSYKLDTSVYPEGTVIKWCVKTRGVTDEYSDFSDSRTVTIYAAPTLQLNIVDKIQNGNELETVSSFPIFVSGIIGSGTTQKPIGYHVEVISTETYESVDDLGNSKFVNEGESVYSVYSNVVLPDDNTDPLVTKLHPGNIDLENGVTYTVRGVVSMDSGLTAEAETDFTVSWTDEVYIPDGEVGIDTDAFTAHIRPYCVNRKSSMRQVSFASGEYSATSTILTEDIINSVYTTTGEEVFMSMNTDKTLIYYCPVYSDVNGNPIDPIYYLVTRTSNTFTKTRSTINPSSLTSVFTKDGEEVFLYTDDAKTGVYYYAVVDESEIVKGVTLSVYRREFDGAFTELATDIDNESNTFITDPHPALDYARYRIIATSNTTGAVSYTDLPGTPVGGKAIIIQWDEDWSSFDTPDSGLLAEPTWAGSMLKLHYNINVSDNNQSDVELVEYIGRSHPVSYYGTQLGQSATWNVDIEKNDEETLYALRRLQRWMGDVYVREPSGSGYWANISVSFSQTHLELTIPVTINVKRVEGGV